MTVKKAAWGVASVFWRSKQKLQPELEFLFAAVRSRDLFTGKSLF